ncbi:MAG TPA: winged helix-turn-helix domain-containing protein [Rhodanobacteraceae bacterium]|nr:winged helix-turn-helix domain-containing protein [Rhodanobacteraceae bacterium]
MSANGKPIYRFGEFELDPGERRLLMHGVAITLTPKVFDTLVLLVERAGHAVSKDELMHALWPRGFVDESNLTKHIWLIRKALGGENEARCIETVPKLGYRFVAPVERVERVDEAHGGIPTVAPVPISPAPATDEAEAPRGEDARRPAPAWIAGHDAERRSADAVVPSVARLPVAIATHRRRTTWVATAMAAIVAALAVAWFLRRESASTVAAGRGHAIAIVGFNNLSQNAKDAWLGPALGEMLATEITAGGRVYVLPDELVRSACGDLAAPLAGGYAAASLAALRRRLGADYVLSGGYFVAGAADRPHVRLDLALQDTHSGRAIATLARDAPVADLPALVAEVGSGLREPLGIGTADRGALKQIAHAQPPTSDVARRIGFALDALHRDDAARARDELLDTIAEAPGYAPAYSYLAQAWSALGYGAKAAAAAEQAAAHAEGLPEEQRLHIDLQRAATQRAWNKAAEAARHLVALRPENPDYRLRLIEVLVAAHEDSDAAAALDALRSLAGAAGDPRVELAAAAVARARDDVKGAAAHAREALALAQARDAPGQIADAQHRLGTALYYLGDSDAAQQTLRAAISAYQHIGNPHGEAAAREALGKVLVDTNRGDDAREEYQRAMALFQSIGDFGGTTGVYSDLSRMLWSAGDLDGAKTAAQHVLDLARQTGDLRMQGWGLQALATAASDDAASDEVLEDYRETIALDEKTADESGVVWHLAAYADVLRLRGDLAQADAACKRASDVVARVGDPQFRLVLLFTCAEVSLDRGDVAAAERGLAETLSLAQSTRDPVMTSNAEATLAEIDMGRHRWTDALARLERAADGFAKAEAKTGIADAEAMRALCADALGDAKVRDAAVSRATGLRRGITERQEVFMVDIALAELRARAGDAAAIGDLHALAKDAEARHWLVWSLESRLAAYGVLASRHDPAAGKLRAEIVSSARERGFGWVLARLGEDRA